MATQKGIHGVFSGINGELSSKRVMMFLSFLIMIGLAYTSIFMGKDVQQFMFEGFLYVVVSSLASVASEKFSRKFGNYGNPYGLNSTSIDIQESEFDEEPDCEKHENSMNRWDTD